MFVEFVANKGSFKKGDVYDITDENVLNTLLQKKIVKLVESSNVSGTLDDKKLVSKNSNKSNREDK